MERTQILAQGKEHGVFTSVNGLIGFVSGTFKALRIAPVDDLGKGSMTQFFERS